MPNTEYDTRTPEEKKKLMQGILNIDAQRTEKDDAVQKKDSSEDDGRGHMHKHLA